MSFCEVHQSLPKQSNTTTWCWHPHVSQMIWCFQAWELPPFFSSTRNSGHYGTSVFVSSGYRTCLHVAKQFDFSWYSVLRLESFPLFPPNETVVIMAKKLDFRFIRLQDKIKVFITVSICKLQSGFLMFFNHIQGSWQSGLSAHVSTVLHYTSFNQHLHKVFCFCSWVDTHISDQSPFISGTQNPSPSWAVW